MNLFKRIIDQPFTSAAAVTGGQASPGGTPQTMPIAQVRTYQQQDQYVTLAYQMLRPIWTTDGAAVPATSPGRWGQLVQAGRP